MISRVSHNYEFIIHATAVFLYATMPEARCIKANALCTKFLLLPRFPFVHLVGEKVKLFQNTARSVLGKDAYALERTSM